MIVLGIDGGLASLGYAAVDLLADAERVELLADAERVCELGVLRTAPSGARLQLRKFRSSLRPKPRRLLGAYGRPIAICAESLSLPRSAGAAAKVAAAWGAVVALADVHDLALVQASPQRVKLAVADALVRRYGPTVPSLLVRVPASKREHAFDALGAIVACLPSDAIRVARSCAA